MLSPSLLCVLYFFVTLALQLTRWLAQRQQQQTSHSKQAQLAGEIAILRKEAAKFNTPSTYAKCAKYQRLANSKEKELANLAAVPTWHKSVIRGVDAIQAAVYLASGLLLWGRPIAQLLPRLVSPLGRWLSFPHGSGFSSFGMVAAVPWLMVCSRASSILVQIALPLRQPSAPEVTLPQMDAKKDL